MQKNFYIQTSIKQLLTKYQFLMKLLQISHIHKNRNFLGIIGMTWIDMTGIYFCICASCEPLKTISLSMIKERKIKAVPKIANVEI